MTPLNKLKNGLVCKLKSARIKKKAIKHALITNPNLIGREIFFIIIYGFWLIILLNFVKMK